MLDSFDAGNTNLSDEEMSALVDTLRPYLDNRMSRYQAARYLGLNEKQFDYKVSKGEIPPGRKEPGFKEKFWLKSDLERIPKDK